MSLFSGRIEQVLERSLDALSLRQRVLANNIANVDTPNFKRSDVSFEATLQSYLQGDGSSLSGIRTNARHIPIGVSTAGPVPSGVAVKETTTSLQNNNNNVDIDSEMSQLALNQIRYNALTQQMQSYFSVLRTSINGGGR